MQHHDAPSNQCAVKNSGDSFGPLQAQLEKPFSKSFRVRLTEIRPKRNHPSRQYDISCSKRIRQRQNLVLYRFAVIGDRVIHFQIITNMLVLGKRYRGIAARRAVLKEAQQK